METSCKEYIERVRYRERERDEVIIVDIIFFTQKRGRRKKKIRKRKQQREGGGEGGERKTTHMSILPVMMTSGASPYFLVHMNAASSIALFTISYGLVLLHIIPT